MAAGPLVALAGLVVGILAGEARGPGASGTVLVGGAAGGQADLDVFDLPDEPVEDDLDADPELGVRALLRAGLEDRLARGGLAVDGLAFGEEVGDRLLAVDVLPVS